MDMVCKLRVHLRKFFGNLLRISFRLLVLKDAGTSHRLIVLLTFAVALIVTRITIICILIFCTIRVLLLLRVWDRTGLHLLLWLVLLNFVQGFKRFLVTNPGLTWGITLIAFFLNRFPFSRILAVASIILLVAAIL